MSIHLGEGVGVDLSDIEKGMNEFPCICHQKIFNCSFAFLPLSHALIFTFFISNVLTNKAEGFLLTRIP